MVITHSTVVATLSRASEPILVERHGQQILLKQGDALYATDVMKTHGTCAEILFHDGAKASLGAHTTMIIKDFSSENAEAPAFALELTQGVMRAAGSTDVHAAQQGSGAFQVLTPKTSVGIRGTDFIAKVNADTSEEYALISLAQGSNLVLTTHTGKFASLTKAGQGAFITASAADNILSVTLTQEEVNSLVELIAFVLHEEQGEEQHDDDADKVAEEAVDQNYVALEQSLVEALGDENTQALVEALQDAGFVPLVETEADGTLSFGHVGDDFVLVADAGKGGSSIVPGTTPPEPTPPPMEHVTTDGISDFSADVLDISAGTHILEGQNIRVEGDIDTNIVVSGDAYEISGGLVRAGSDIISGDHMSDGTIVGDVHTITDGELIAGNDTIAFLSKSGGQSIYGDVYNVDNVSAVSFGDDTITIKGDFSNSTIAGDASFVAASVLVKAWGADSIIVEGNVTATTKDTILHGDAVTGGSGGMAGGTDTIIVGGTVSGTNGFKSLVYGGAGADAISVGVLAAGGEIYGGMDDDTILVTNMIDGFISAGHGADTVTIHGSSGNSIIDLGDDGGVTQDTLNLNGSGIVTVRYFNTDTDKLVIDGKEYTVDIANLASEYGNYTIIFEDISGNTAPVFDSAPATLTVDAMDDEGEDNTATYTPQATDSPGDTITYSLKASDGASYGTVSFADGKFTYTTDSDHADVKNLKAGETLTDTFVIVATDSVGATTEKTVTVTVRGNTAPVFDSADATIDVGTVSAAGEERTATYTPKATDTLGDTITYSLKAGDGAAYGTVSFADGEFTYTTDGTHVDVKKLKANEKLTDTFVVVATDSVGATAEKTVTVTMQGVNDKPEIDIAGERNVVLEGSAAEQLYVTYTASDVDSTITSVEVSGVHSSAGENSQVLNGTLQYVHGTYGALAIAGTVASGEMIYLVSSSQKAALLLGMTSNTLALQETFTFVATDEHGEESTVDLTFALSTPTMTFLDAAPQEAHLSDAADNVKISLNGAVVHVYGDSTQSIKGADDMLVIQAGDSIEAGSRIAGDKNEQTTAVEGLTGGHDFIVIDGDIEAGVDDEKTYIVGDLVTIGGAASYTMGHDSIIIKGDVSGSNVVIAGDFAVVDGVGVEVWTGHDEILVTGTVTNTTIYGDSPADPSTFTDHVAGADAILVYTLGENASIMGGGGDDEIQANTLAGNASIDAGNGSDIITVKNTAESEGGRITAGAGKDKVTVTLNDGVDNLVIDLRDGEVDTLIYEFVGKNTAAENTTVTILLDEEDLVYQILDGAPENMKQDNSGAYQSLIDLGNMQAPNADITTYFRETLSTP